MNNLNMFCITLEPSHLNFIKSLNYIPVGLGDKKFSKQEQEKFTKRFGNKTTVSILGLLNISNMPIIEKKVMSAYAEASILLKSDREKIIKELKEIYQGVDEHSEDSKQNFERLIKILN